MTKKNTEKRLPKFKVLTLRADELRRATGGQMPDTRNTLSMCASDGNDTDD